MLTRAHLHLINIDITFHQQEHCEMTGFQHLVWKQLWHLCREGKPLQDFCEARSYATPLE